MICDHDDDVIFIKEKGIKKFVLAMKKISTVSAASQNILIISNDKKKHVIAEKLRNIVLKCPEYSKHDTLPKKIINGTIDEKNSSSFSLIEEDNLKQNKINKLKFFLTSNSRFTIVTFSRSGEKHIQKTINWKNIKNGDSVNIMFCEYKQKNIISVISKIKYDSK